MFEPRESIRRAGGEAMEATKAAREKVRESLYANQEKVLAAFTGERVGEHHFFGTTGYGFNDAGREALDRVFARIFGAESAIVRHSIVSGTHALSAVMRGNLRPGDEILCATGEPYDTIKPVLGLDKKWGGGLDEWGITTKIAPLDGNGRPSLESILEGINEKTRMAFIQRSRGYTWRPSYNVELIASLTRAIKERKESVIVMVDNCYGEMVETLEPAQAGADVMGGSLIKNMGAGVAPTGGYIVGRRDVVERSASALTCPGIGGDEGATLGLGRLLFQGVFMAPLIVSQALEGAIWASYLLESLGIETSPRWDEHRTDIIQGIKLGSVEKQKAFCRGIQEACPVDSTAVPEAADLPGYRDPILMAGGTFIQGSSIELSCDGPLRPPYAVYLQGGLSFAHVQIGVQNAVERMKREGLI
jgi:cystathionine beta-lyase family protein involved in aluminum resistance